MRRYFHAMLALLMLGLLATGALGQPVDAPVAAGDGPDIFDTLVSLFTIWLPRVVLVASALTAIFPSGNKVMAVVDAFAVAWGKARNDPAAQGWGKRPK